MTAVTLTLVAALLPATTTAAAAATGGTVDTVTFGDPESERAHDFSGDSTTVVDGANGRKARVAEPLSPPTSHLGDLRLSVKVDPAAQNYLSLKFWGEDVSTYKTVLFVNGAQTTYRSQGDYEAINTGTGKGLDGRFFVNTAMLPLSSTQGRERVELILRTYHPSLTATATERSRKYYQALVHTSPELDMADEDDTGYQPTTKAAPALTAAEEKAKIDGLRSEQLALFDRLSAKSDASPGATLNISRYQDELRFYTEVLLTDWSPAKTPADKRLALDRVFKSIDNFTKQYYGNVRSLGDGGHQSDWGGYYSALGEALYIVENLIADDQVYGAQRFTDFLGQPFETGTADGPNSLAGVDWTGGALTRGEAWERVLKANFDFARSRLSYIYNQVMYTYEGAWKAHEGLRVIGSGFFEGKPRSHAIVGEALGSRPFLGEEVLVGPNGEELDLYHSLFQHDRNAVYNEAYLKVVMRGLAKSKLDAEGKVVRRLPYGKHYTGVTRDGQTRENTYVGNYGESTNYVTSWFFRTLDHAGDEELNNEILKLALRNVHARGHTRYQSTDANGNRVMLMQQVIDERNAAYPGRIAYASDINSGRGLMFAALEQFMADNADKYAGPEWTPFWGYAREAVGFAQQQLVDNQYFPYFNNVLANHKYDLRLPKTYEYVTGKRAEYAVLGGKAAAGVVLPHTDPARYTDEELARLGISRDDAKRPFAWVDIDNMYVSVRDGDTHLFGSLFQRNRGFLGNGRLHAQHGDHDQLVQLQTQGVLAYQDYVLRPNAVEDPMFYDRYTAPDRPLAMTGELAPIAYQPGVGTVVRDNWMSDNPYSGYPDLLTARYGKYLMAVNGTRPEHGNAKAHHVRLPTAAGGGNQTTAGEGDGQNAVVDLVTGRRLPIIAGVVAVPPSSAVVLDLGTDEVKPSAPSAVDVAVATPGSNAVGLTWRPAAGATSYTITRAVREQGPFYPVAHGVRGTSHIDKTPSAGTFFYRVTAVNGQGLGRPSNAIKAVVTQAHTAGLRNGPWRDDVIGNATGGSSSVEGSAITVNGASGTGFGGGDDTAIYNRFHADSLVTVSRLAQGSTVVSAKLDGAGGVILRDSADAVGRYAYLGVDATGALSFKYRSLDTRTDIGTGTAGQNATGGITRSPFAVDLKGHQAATHPYVKLIRLADSHRITALVSEDGQVWEQVATADVPMVDVVHAGVATTQTARFGDVEVDSLPAGTVLASGRFGDRTGTVSWTRPRDVIAFDLYRTRDAAVAGTDPSTDPGSGWEKIVDNRWALSYEDTIYGGAMHYKVVARRLDGSTTVSAPVTITAEPFPTVLAKARTVSADDYTAASFGAFKAEVDAAEQASTQPGADEAALIKRVYDAYRLLVPVHRHSFEADESDVWQAAGTGPYTRVIASDRGRTGTRSLYFASTDTSGNGSFNMSFHNRKQGASPISVTPGKTYKVSYWYQLTNYVPGRTVGAYLFVSSRDGGAQIGVEQRTWLPAGDTAPGQWKYVERTYRADANPVVDNVSLDFGFRGSSGEFRVDDVRVEPVD
ncbi:carbohydrate binding domain-containing protein [Saccharothrix deserti]|uniref:carbohydrate binding domain-containing protein n=1 Tax=Saccharothrix deserti TaxID=2593674 RepID=UPI00131E28A4|nr:carbohydrate binding domain-containing protein [Saccharothrix deserti]